MTGSPGAASFACHFKSREVALAFSGRLASVPGSSFRRLAQLIEGIEPESFPGKAPVIMTVGEPQDAPPSFVSEIVQKHARDFGRYPPLAGNAAFRAACAGWLTRRFKLPKSALDPETNILPLSGSREGLFFSVFPLVPESKNGGRPVVLIPNPFYSVYPAGTVAAGAEPYYVPTSVKTGFLPDFDSVPEDVLRRTIAAFYCSPSNPEGACATAAQWRRVFQLADQYDFTVFADECYCELYDETPPIGALSVRLAMGRGLERVMSFHSLSKRSSAPGLRSGFVAGPADAIATLTAFRNTSAPQMPLPILEASSACWSDESHVEQARALYRERFAIAKRILGNTPGFRIPEGGFYLWLDVGNGAEFARELWRKKGVKVMPGAYMAVEGTSGDPASNPGHRYVRIALVHDSLTIQAALERVADFLNGAGRK
jgi:aspartate/methionine/tyrosine aminotransferase